MATDSADFVSKWHQVISNHDIDLLETLLSENIVFNTPLYLKVRKGKVMTKAILASAITLFQDFKYYNEWVSQDGLNLALEFGAHISAKDTSKQMGLKGVDLIQLKKEADGKFRIVNFEVMLRPVNALQRFGELQAEGIPKMLAKFAPNSKL
ncbi:hypothetical protein HDU98_010105 [Podochytrium sp. JEL0797]|nr:hypothetical protein HDU98_010105 [Podochytrium sp. JEL0797]